MSDKAWDKVFKIDTGKGLVIEVSPLGASLRSCKVDGIERTLGYADAATYARNPVYLACCVGRFANRIAGGRFAIDGEHYQLDTNNGENHLHGGSASWAVREWDANRCQLDLVVDHRGVRADAVKFSLVCPAGLYPGNVKAETIVFAFERTFGWLWRASTDAPTVVNMTNHAYWNLGSRPSIHGHSLKLAASSWLEVDGGSIPTGTFVPCKGSDFDFTKGKLIDTCISPSGAIRHKDLERGIDHNFVVDSGARKTAISIAEPGSHQEFVLREAASLALDSSTMKVLTSLPGVQVYTGNYLDGEAGRNGPLGLHAGLCLETQLFPDAPNQGEAYRKKGLELGWSADEVSNWDAVLRPSNTFEAVTMHQF